MSAEAKVAFDTNAPASTVRTKSKEILIKSGSGEDVIPDHELFLPWIAEWAGETSLRDQSNVSIRGFPFVNQNLTLGQLKVGRLRTPDEQEQVLISLWSTLSNEIERRGDQRVSNGKQVAADFIRETINVRQSLPGNLTEFIEASLTIQGIDLDEVSDQMKISEILDLGCFRMRLKVVAPHTGVPFNQLKRSIFREQLPSEIITQHLETFRKSQPRLRGSDLEDQRLGCLAPYVDVLYVDKRTAEGFRQALQRDGNLIELVGDIRKSVNWQDVLHDLGG